MGTLRSEPVTPVMAEYDGTLFNLIINIKKQCHIKKQDRCWCKP